MRLPPFRPGRFAQAVLVPVFLACGGGGGGAPRVAPALVPPVPAASGVATAGMAPTHGPSSTFGSQADQVLAELLADSPSTARQLGLHDYDGQVAAVSKDAVVARISRLRQAAADLANVDRATLSDDDAIDLGELESWVSQDLFWLVDADVTRTRPQFYDELFDVSVYLDRDYAPLEERAKHLTDQEEAALAQVGHIRENLSPPLSRPVTEVAARNMAGFSSYLRGDVVTWMQKVGDDSLKARFAKANEALAKAAAELASWLKVEAARGDQSHVLGTERYTKLLQAQEGLSLPLADFERLNEDNLAANKKAYEELAPHVKTSAVKESEYFATAARMMKDTREFVVSRRIVTIVGEDAATVRETPAYERWNAASIEMSGPFEKAKSAFYQLTLPDKAWPPRERQAYLGTLGNLLGTTLHEVYPGHFVQGRWQERAPSRVQKAFGNYAFVEGWAHYSEQMMIDEGFGSDDPANRLAMLSGALLRNCRFAASVGIHTRGMTVEQAEKRFVDDCHQARSEAHEQAVRGTFDPGYFAYTLGKLQILALREEARKEMGEKFSLQRFHDALLSHGAPPLALVHDRLLRDLAAAP